MSAGPPLLVARMLAHAGGIIGPDEAWRAWSFDPAVVLGIAIAAWFYTRGARVLRSTASGRRALPTWRSRCFWGALLAIAVAILSPVDAIGRSLFAAHMFQHQLLVFVAAPLLVLARPLLVSAVGLPRRWRGPAAGVRVAVSPTQRSHPRWAAFVAVSYLAVAYVWHMPVVYEAAVRSDLLHALQHSSWLGAGAALWWIVLDARGRQATAAGTFAVFVAMLGSSFLAGVLNFGANTWYTVHEAGAAAWGLTPREDQDLAGGLMWFPGAPAMVLAGALVFYRFLSNDEQEADLADLRERVAVSRAYQDD